MASRKRSETVGRGRVTLGVVPARCRATAGRIGKMLVCEAHDPTGEPGAGNRHAGFGEQGLET